ncbi:polysaccharide deacetylase family protein [Streptococcus halichoeri]|uniref:polysaccharide deacetylase family protein n=1 Tax=Streptococcus halichoeri TaxID=254785 RepID=UPI00135B4C88|nr:polysaccharide deacetylase family protein [Streptococcus halichoeri]
MKKKLIITIIVLIALLGGLFVAHKVMMHQSQEKLIQAHKEALIQQFSEQDRLTIKRSRKRQFHFTLADKNNLIAREIAKGDGSKETIQPMRLVFIEPKIIETPIKGIRRVKVQRVQYDYQWTAYQKTSEKDLRDFYIDSKNTLFGLDQLLGGKVDFLSQLIKKQDPSLQTSEQQLEEMFKHPSTKKLPFKIDQHQLVIDSQIALPISDLFEVINPAYLPKDEQANYADYQKKKEEALKKARENRKVIALTFDDGPDAETTPQVLNILAKYHAVGTFFMIGSKVAGHEALVKKVYDQGNEIGNHTWTHPNLTLLSPDQVKAEINQTNQVLEKITGKKPVFLRPPYGATNERVKEITGMEQAMWTVDTRDWENHSTQGIMTNLKNQAGPNGVVLMHDIHQTSVNALPSVIEYLQSQGYSFVTLSQLYAS